jgi:hypothetical protein
MKYPDKEERRRIYESMKKEMEQPCKYSWILIDFNDNWIKHYKKLKEEFGEYYD